MNTSESPVLRRARRLRLFAAIAVPAGLPLPGAGGSAAPVPPSPPRPYTLYMGADLTVEWHGKLWAVRGVERNSFVIDAEGRRVPVRDTDLKMRIDPRLKLTAAYATIAGLQVERAYTPANDPRHHAHDTMMAASEASDDLDIAAYNLNRLQSAAGRPGGSTVTPAMMAAAQGAFQRSLADQGSVRYSVANAISREQDELARKLFDALQLSFEISSRQPLTDAYLVIIVRFRDKGGDPKTTRLLVYAQVLSSIGQNAQTVRLFRGGFPRGYELVDCQIHIYDHGFEVATNTAPKQMKMTRGEAFEYSMLEYVAGNRDRTLPPLAARAFWPQDFSARLPATTLDRTFYAKVGSDGRATGLYDDQACMRPVGDAALKSIMPDLRFDPALEKGKPVAGVVAVNLGRGPE